MFKFEYIDIDLTKFRNISGRLIPGEQVELKIIEFYRYIQNEDNNIFELFTKYLLKILYKDDIDRDYYEIYTIYKEKFYIHTVNYFNELLDMYILNKIDPIFVDIVFDSYVENSDDKIVVKFKIIKVDDGRK